MASIEKVSALLGCVGVAFGIGIWVAGQGHSDTGRDKEISSLKKRILDIESQMSSIEYKKVLIGEVKNTSEITSSEIWNNNALNTAKLHCPENQFLTGIELSYRSRQSSRDGHLFRGINGLKSFCAKKTDD